MGKLPSVLITTYRRMDSIGSVVGAWLEQPVGQVWLIDGSGGQALDRVRPEHQQDSRFEYWPLWRDHGTRTDYALAHLTDGERIILADDDVVPLKGFTDDILRGHREVAGDIVGIIGRTFHGPRYYQDTRYYRSDQIDAPKQVGFVGVVYCAERVWFGFDTRGQHRNCDDLWWQMRVHPAARKWVVPTQAYQDLPAARDGMFHSPALRKARERFYEEMWRTHYATTGRIA